MRGAEETAESRRRQPPRVAAARASAAAFAAALEEQYDEYEDVEGDDGGAISNDYQLEGRSMESNRAPLQEGERVESMDVESEKTSLPQKARNRVEAMETSGSDETADIGAVAAPSTKEEEGNRTCGACRCALNLPAQGQVLTVVCSNGLGQDRSCPHPWYHLSCARIPLSSRVYRETLRRHYMQTSTCSFAPASERGDSQDRPFGNYSASKSAITDDDSDGVPSNTAFEGGDVGFLCPACDYIGTSRYLNEYFEDFRNSKVRFNDDEEAVDARNASCAFIRSLISTVPSLSVQSSSTSTASLSDQNPSPNCARRVQSEISLHHLTEIIRRIPHGGAEKRGSPSRKQSSSPQREECLDPTFLVGQPVRFFCPVDNSYHSGRIVDWRKNVESNQKRRSLSSGASSSGAANSNDSAPDFDTPRRRSKRACVNPSTADSAAPTVQLSPLDAEIGCTQYLVRFREGVDGRKVAVHQWIYLEEHALSVGIFVVWADQNRWLQSANKEKGSSQGIDDVCRGADELRVSPEKSPTYRPAQLVVRSALEVAALKDIRCVGDNQSSKSGTEAASCANVLAHFFGKPCRHAVVRLRQKWRGEMDAAVGTVDFQEPPSQVEGDLQLKHFQDKSVPLSVALACMELEEQRRVRTWHKLSENPVRVVRNSRRPTNDTP